MAFIVMIHACLSTTVSMAGAFEPNIGAAVDIGEDDKPNRVRQAEDAGLWPSERMISLLLRRWVEAVGDGYELSSEQKARMVGPVVGRWSEFLSEHRESLQPLVNDYLEMRLDLEPPNPERIRAWLDRAEPMVARLSEEITAAADDIRPVLTSVQRARFEADFLQWRARLSLAGRQLHRWREHGAPPEEFWEPVSASGDSQRADGGGDPGPFQDRATTGRQPSRSPNRDGQEITSQSESGHPKWRGTDVAPDADRWDRSSRTNRPPSSDGSIKLSKSPLDSSAGDETPRVDAPPDQIALEVSAWEKFVTEFIVSHGLDEGQRTAAVSIFEELRARALNHRDNHRAEIGDLEERIRSHRGVREDIVDIKAKLVRLYGPIDEMFLELQSRLERQLTTTQRRSAPPAESSRSTEESESPPTPVRERE